MKEEILVSIICLTYNHEKYIRDAIESFLAQQVKFKYEILIHDDASTDNTAKIIAEYEKRFPEIIKPIYQINNQYSQKVKIIASILFPKAKGKYIALCEGDDYWTDPLKLQKQVDYLQKHKYCSLCVHRAAEVNAKTHEIISDIAPAQQDAVFMTEQIILGDGCMFATNSMVFPKKYCNSLPKFYYATSVDDYPLMIYLSLYGYVYYMNDNMSAYRRGVEGSWTETLERGNYEKKIQTMLAIENMLLMVNEYTGRKFTAEINNVITKKKIFTLYKLGDLAEFRKGRYRNQYDNLSLRWKVIVFIMEYFPKLTSILLKINKRYKII